MNKYQITIRLAIAAHTSRRHLLSTACQRSACFQLPAAGCSKRAGRRRRAGMHRRAGRGTHEGLPCSSARQRCDHWHCCPDTASTWAAGLPCIWVSTAQLRQLYVHLHAELRLLLPKPGSDLHIVPLQAGKSSCDGRTADCRCALCPARFMHDSAEAAQPFCRTSAPVARTANRLSTYCAADTGIILWRGRAGSGARWAGGASHLWAAGSGTGQQHDVPLRLGPALIRVVFHPASACRLHESASTFKCALLKTCRQPRRQAAR